MKYEQAIPLLIKVVERRQKMSKRDIVKFWEAPLHKSFKRRTSIRKASTLFIRLARRLPKKLRMVYWYIRNPKVLYWYARHPTAERCSYYDHPQPDAVFESLKTAGLPIQELYAADYFPGFRAYLERTREIYRQAGYFHLFDEDGYFLEKALEHYLSLELLEVCNKDLLLDVVAWGFPVAAIAERERGCVAFSQDLVFNDGVHGRKIGSDVRNIPMPDASFTKIVAHCAIDNFEGDADIAFIQEAYRLLQPKGILMIVPLHMATRFENIIDPFEENVTTDPNAIKVYKPLCGFRFGRHYDVNHLQTRLLNVVPFHPQIYYFKDGFNSFHPACHLRFVLKLVKKSSG